MVFSVTILGSNSALPTSERYPTAQLLNVAERFYLIDCGEGTQMQLRRNKIKFTKINHIFISHLHGDHLFGLMGLISTLGLMGRQADLHLFAHVDLERLYRPHLDYFCADLPFKVVFHAIDPHQWLIIHEDDKVMVTSVPLRHRIATCGFLFTEKIGLPNIRKSCIEQYELSIAEIVKIKNGADLRLDDGTIVPNDDLIVRSHLPRSYAFCSDTKYIPSLGEKLKGIDLLYHEATFTDAEKDLAKKTGHSTARQAAMVAKQAEVGKLIIGHFSSRYKQTDVYLEQAREVFPLTEIAGEGCVFEVAVKPGIF
ncbi:ribonuclease Z [Breznakibacter xylanolyticus]|uniref:Ribonuclease Z n=1 Tax=Breznakibacter xylanolyticus TaxID=990 RepID=A0A2W7NPJ9_9BACT|nr:ribonuclease Z [Breznakibacter xylanolyticus]MBN2743612.1 ribonuclease Z [Marinilabiliaceae bacterium]PZX15166.1 ribonuclease Z [Breznakibacter xylanolyticus]